MASHHRRGRAGREGGRRHQVSAKAVLLWRGTYKQDGFLVSPHPAEGLTRRRLENLDPQLPSSVEHDHHPPHRNIHTPASLPRQSTKVRLPNGTSHNKAALLYSAAQKVQVNPNVVFVETFLCLTRRRQENLDPALQSSVVCCGNRIKAFVAFVIPVMALTCGMAQLSCLKVMLSKTAIQNDLKTCVWHNDCISLSGPIQQCLTSTEGNPNLLSSWECIGSTSI